MTEQEQIAAWGFSPDEAAKWAEHDREIVLDAVLHDGQMRTLRALEGKCLSYKWLVYLRLIDDMARFAFPPEVYVRFKAALNRAVYLDDPHALAKANNHLRAYQASLASKHRQT